MYFSTRSLVSVNLFNFSSFKLLCTPGDKTVLYTAVEETTLKLLHFLLDVILAY